MFNVSSGLATLGPDALDIIAALERKFGRWAHELGARPYSYPALLPVADLTAIDYFENFPHLGNLVGPLRLDRIEAEYANHKVARTAIPSTDLEDPQFVLPSAVCYGAYFSLRGTTITAPLRITSFGRCFRREREYIGLERLWSFQMRELICVGDGDTVQHHLTTLRTRIEDFARRIDLPLTIEAATDPFFDRRSSRAKLQQIFPVKEEFVYRTDRGDLAIASANFHRNFFGERCQIQLPDGSPAFTGCVGFGLERWIAALSHRFGGSVGRIAAALESA